MRNAAPGGSGPTNRIINEKGGSNEIHNKNRTGFRKVGATTDTEHQISKGR